MYTETIPWKENYDEAEIPPYQLPDVLTCADGTKITTAGQWLDKRRPELLKMFRDIMYGNPLPLPDKVAYTLLTEKCGVLNGLATRREIRLDFMMDTGRRHSVILLLYLPANAIGKVPVCVNLTFGGNQVITDEDDVFMTGLQGKTDVFFPQPGSQTRRYPLEYIMGRGYALAVASYHDFFPDTYNSNWAGSVYDLFRDKDELKGRPRDASAIAAWAWGMSRIMDYLETVQEIDSGKALCIGHSRLGKTSLWAGVNDERFKVVCVNDSGCGGAALNRRLFGETLFSMFKNSPIGDYWFNDEMEQHCRHPEDLPFDQHELLALVAPRTLCVHSATEDLWADPDSEYLAACHASPVWRLFGKEGLEAGTLHAPDISVGADVSYFRRTGKHDLLLADWQQYLDAADRTFHGA